VHVSLAAGSLSLAGPGRTSGPGRLNDFCAAKAMTLFMITVRGESWVGYGVESL
jgi:hypothetical protein